MSTWPGRLRRSPDVGVAARVTVSRRAAMPARWLVLIALACAALGVVLHQGLAAGSRSATSVARSHTAARESLSQLAAQRQDSAARGATGIVRLESLPLQGQSVISTSLGADAPVFAAESSGAGYRSSGGGISALFGARGVALRTGTASLSFVSVAISHGGRIERPDLVSISAQRNRVTYQRDGLTEWYAAGPLGIEQGFTVARRPAGASKDLTVALGLNTSLRARRAGSELEFLTRSGQVALRYGGLSASAAGGRRLPATLTVHNGELLIRVTDAGAAYPLRIDPLVEVGSKIAPSDESGVGGSYFGWDVALSSDGTTALIGGPWDGNNSSDDSQVGAAWVYKSSGGTWSEQAKLHPSDNSGSQSYFGVSVALSADGNTALIGGFTDGSGQTGAAWVYTRSGSSWSEQEKLAGPTSGGFFGGSVALSADGTTALIGSDGDNSDVGAAYVYTRSGSSWSEKAKLTAPTSGPDEELGAAYFGNNVALSSAGTTALIGGQYDGDVGGDNDNVGAAWVYTGSGSSWSTGTKLTAPTAPSSEAENGYARFGFEVALSADGTTALIGGPLDNSGVGAAWVFTGSGASWAAQAKLIAPTSGSDAESGDAYFGAAVALGTDGDTDLALIGGYADSTSVGAAWMYSGTGSSWTELAKLIAPTEADDPTDAEIGAGIFGNNVALSADGTTSLLAGEGDNGNVGAAWPWVPADGFFGPGVPVYGSSSDGVAVGTTETQYVNITNEGYLPRVLTTTGLSGPGASSFSVASDGCTGQTLEPGGICTIGVNFSPTTTGSFAAQLTVTDNAPQSPHVFSLVGYAGSPAASFSASPLVFGTNSDAVGEGTTATQMLTITNSGDAPLQLGTLGLTGAQASTFSLTSDECSGTTLAPGASCPLSVNFSPGAPGTFDAQVNVPDDAPGNPQSVALSGDASGLASASVSPSSLSFGSPGEQSVTLTNTSSTTRLNVSATTINGTDAAHFMANSSCASGPIHPGGQCTVAVSFEPSDTGTYQAQLQLADNAPDSPQIVTLTGSGGTDVVEGHIYDGTQTPAAPLAGATVSACPVAQYIVTTACVSTTTGPDGSYQLPSGAGLILVQVSPPTSALFEASARVTVPAGGASTQDFTLQPPVGLSDGVSFDGETSGVPVLSWISPFTLTVPLPIAQTGTPNSTQLYTGFTGLDTAAQSSSSSQEVVQAAAIIFAAHYGTDGDVQAVSDPMLAALDCDSSASQNAACVQLANGCPDVNTTTYGWSSTAVTITEYCADGTVIGPITVGPQGVAGFASGSSSWANSGIGVYSPGVNVSSQGQVSAGLTGINSLATSTAPPGNADAANQSSNAAWTMSSEGLNGQSHGGSAVFSSVTGGTLSGNVGVGQQTTVPVRVYKHVIVDVYVDPSGVVRTKSGIPIGNATVTLRRTATKTGAPKAVPNGSVIMSPANRRNPDRTNALGAYGWDVLPGYYRITASHAGCAAHHGAMASSPLFAVPPAQTGVNLELSCPHLHRSKVRIQLTIRKPTNNGVGVYQLTANVHAPAHGASAQGTVSFYAGHKLLAAISLDPRSARAMFPLPAGARTASAITAVYSGDDAYDKAETHAAL